MDKTSGKISVKNWILVWVLGLTGQICWNIENSWFNTFVYDRIAPNPSIISWMVGVSATITTLATFLIGTWSDRKATRKPFIAVGYILWGLFTIVFGTAEFMPRSSVLAAAVFVVAADAVMSFFGSVGNDGGFSAWTTDISNEHNRGKIGGAIAVMPVLATIFGAVVSGIIIEKAGFFTFFVVMGSLVSAIGIVTLFTLEDAPDLVPKHTHNTYWQQFMSVFNYKTVSGNKELFWVFVVMSVYFIGFNVYFPYITIYFVNYLNMSYSTTGIIQGVGLLTAALMTIPAARIIDRGKSPALILIAIGFNIIGIAVLCTGKTFMPVLLGTFGVGMGYIIVVQTLTAWIKNLYPEHQRGQFEGIRIVFSVCLPMIFGPAIATPIINNFGIQTVINGVEGVVPTETLFLFSLVITSLAVLPLIPANKLFKERMSVCKNS